jgi:hypothetical protein
LEAHKPAPTVHGDNRSSRFVGIRPTHRNAGLLANDESRIAPDAGKKRWSSNWFCIAESPNSV